MNSGIKCRWRRLHSEKGTENASICLGWKDGTLWPVTGAKKWSTAVNTRQHHEARIGPDEPG